MHSSIHLFCAVLVTALWSAVDFRKMSHQNTHEGFSLKQNWIRRYNRVVLVLCNRTLDKFELLFLKQTRAKTTVWSSSHAAFHKGLEQNMFLKVRSFGVLPDIFRRQDLSLHGGARRTLLLNTADLVILSNDIKQKTSIRDHRIQSLCAGSSEPEKLEAIDGTILEQIAYPHSRFSKEIKRQSKFTEAFDGREVVFACPPLYAVRKDYTACNDSVPNFMLDALRSLNATVKLSFYADFASARNALFKRDADILFDIFVTSENIFNDFFFPEIVEFRHVRFYVWKGKASVSFVTFFARSWPVLLSLLVAMMAALMTINFGQCLAHRRSGCFRLTGDWAMFHLASVLAIPAQLPREFAGNRRGRYSRSQQLMIGVWLLGVLPLCVYFRGELTSSLAVIIPPDPIDTIRELEDALDEGKFHPCLLNESSQDLFLSDSSQSSNQVLRGKLMAAFERHSKTVQLNFDDLIDCLDSCATRPGFACFLYGLGDCYLKSNITPYIESQDELGLALISTPVRKDFPLAKQYNKVTRRVFETALDPYAFNFPRWCPSSRPTNECSTAILTGSKEILTLHDIHVFLFLFVGLLLLSICILCIEIAAFSRWYTPR